MEPQILTGHIKRRLQGKMNGSCKHPKVIFIRDPGSLGESSAGHRNVFNSSPLSCILQVHACIQLEAWICPDVIYWLQFLWQCHLKSSLGYSNTNIDKYSESIYHLEEQSVFIMCSKSLVVLLAFHCVTLEKETSMGRGGQEVCLKVLRL